MMKTKVEYKQGKELLRSYKDDATKSGKVLERFFCSKCVRSCDLDDCLFCVYSIVVLNDLYTELTAADNRLC